MLSAFLIGVLLQLTPQLDQADIHIVPEQPSTADVISARLSGTWHDGCVPRGAQVALDKQVVRITLQLPPEGTICMQALTDWSLTPQIGRLAAGTFQVEVVRKNGDTTTTMGRASFRVSSVRAGF